MPSTITATLRQAYNCEFGISFVIQTATGSDLDWITVELKTKGKHRDKACWSTHTHYKAHSIGDWLAWLMGYGFDTAEFETACIQLGWEKEVREFKKSLTATE